MSPAAVPRVTIKSDGAAFNTSIEVDGEPVPAVRSATWHCSADGFATVSLEVEWPALEALGDLTAVYVVDIGPYCPWCGKKRSEHRSSLENAGAGCST